MKDKSGKSGSRKCCVQFQKLNGSQLTFVRHFNEYRTEQNCLAFADDCCEDTGSGEKGESPILQAKEAPLKMLEDELDREGVDYL